jgi:uncharacterized protein (TIGR02265 family)
MLQPMAANPPQDSLESPVIFSQTVQGALDALGRAPTPAEKAGLREVGLDLDRPLDPAYPAEAFGQMLIQLAKARSPDLPLEEACRELGERFFERHTQTLIGKAMGQVLRLIGVRRSLARMERNFRSGNNYYRSRMVDQGPGKVRLYFDATHDPADFLRGVVIAGARYVGAKDFRAEVVERGSASCALDISWSET